MLDLTKIDQNLLVSRKANSGDNIVLFGRIGHWSKVFTATVNKADEGKEGAAKKFRLNFLIPPVADLKYLKQRCQECAQQRFGEKLATMKLKSPFLKAEDYKYDGHQPGWTYLRLTSNDKPQLVEAKDGALIRIMEEDDEVFYEGRWAEVTVRPFAYPKAGGADLGNRGISLNLANIKLMMNDDNLSRRVRAEDEFEAVDVPENSTGGKTVDELF